MDVGRQHVKSAIFGTLVDVVENASPINLKDRFESCMSHRDPLRKYKRAKLCNSAGVFREKNCTFDSRYGLQKVASSLGSSDAGGANPS